ncbi:peptidoglycan-binding domain-containing protein [Streptomyces syringium]|uniref:peptidoglycan-binding domain-containing protein n=1 Tax=Streptomyces syringium TaxID=76729 RepID=UPI0033FB62F9
MSTRRWTLGMAVVLAAGAPILLDVGTAQAATPTCDTSVSYTTVHGSSTTIPAARRNVSCLLARGNSGNGVKALQLSLNECYGERLARDGIFGAGTQAALRRAQSQEGQTADGVYGPRTRDALHWRVAGFACDRVNGPG